MKKILSVLLAVLVLAGMLTVAASAAEGGVKEASINVATVNAQGAYASLSLTVVEGGGAKYLVTDEDGVAYTSGATEENYNVKFEYKDGMATVYLKNANLKNNNSAGLGIGKGASGDKPAIVDFPCTIVVESDSTIEGGHFMNGTKMATYSGLTFANIGDNVITGPGKLTCKSQFVYALWNSASNLTFKDAKVELIRGYGYGDGYISAYPTLWSSKDGAGDLTFDNSEVTITNHKGSAIVCSTKNGNLEGTDTGDIIVKNGSKLTVTNDGSARPCIATTTGEFKIDNAEVTITSYSLPFSPKPVMTGVGAVGGTKASNAKPYSEKKVSGYTYFHCGPDVKVEEVTTPPTTTVPPTTQQVPPTTQQVPPTTQAAPPVTQQQVPPTTGNASGVNKPVDNDSNSDSGAGAGAVVLVAVLATITVLAVGAAVTLIIIKKKKGLL